MEKNDEPNRKQESINNYFKISKYLKADLKDLLILNESKFSLPYLRSDFMGLKIYNTGNHEAHRLVVDKNGKMLNYVDLIQKENSLKYRKIGRIQSELYRLANIKDKHEIPVLIKFTVKEERIDKSRIEDEKESEEIIKRSREMLSQIEEQAEKLFHEILSEYKIKVPERIKKSGPFVSAVLNKEVILKISKDERVSFIGLDQEKEIPDYPTVEESLPTTGTNTIQGLGIKGKGVKIAVLESGGLSIDKACFNIQYIQDNSVPADSHMTKSAGIIGTCYDDGKCEGDWIGYAPEAEVLIANAADYKDRYDWAKSKNANIITMSWHHPSEETDGGLHSRDVYFDYMVTHYPWPTIFSSAGNQALSNAYASGKGYNFFGVGNILNDGDANRCNDVISSDSSWKDPVSTHMDREIPEIAAPGSRHALLGSSFGGTSCATPVTASIAALLMSHKTNLKIWPEAIRAILLATANYQLADGLKWSYYSSDGKDGTGLVNTRLAKNVADVRESTTTPRSQAHYYGTMHASDFDNRVFTKTWKVRCTSIWHNIRVALAWNSKTTSENGEPTSSELDADLDLLLYDPDGKLVRWSMSWDNNYEFIDFAPEKVGDYTIKIYGWNVPATFWSWYGIAWTTYGRFCLSKIVGVLTEDRILSIAETQRSSTISLNEFLENMNISIEDVESSYE